MSMIQMRRGERINSRELRLLEPRWAAVGRLLDGWAAEVDAMVEPQEPCS